MNYCQEFSGSETLFCGVGNSDLPIRKVFFQYETETTLSESRLFSDQMSTRRKDLVLTKDRVT